MADMLLIDLNPIDCHRVYNAVKFCRKRKIQKKNDC